MSACVEGTIGVRSVGERHLDSSPILSLAVYINGHWGAIFNTKADTARVAKALAGGRLVFENSEAEKMFNEWGR